MNKLAAYEQGVIEGLAGLDLPRNVKLAAYQFLVKQAAPVKNPKGSTRKPSNEGGRGGGIIPSLPSVESMLDRAERLPSADELGRAYSTSSGALNRAVASLTPDAIQSLFPPQGSGGYSLDPESDGDMSTEEVAMSMGPAMSTMSEEDLAAYAYDPDRDEQGPSLKDLMNISGSTTQAEGMSRVMDQIGRRQAAMDRAEGMSRVMDEISPSYLQTALNLAKENPGLAAAAGLGTVGLGYGASRLLS